MCSHRSIAVAGVANRTSDNSPAADSAAGEVEEDGHLMVRTMTRTLTMTMVMLLYVGPAVEEEEGGRSSGRNSPGLEDSERHKGRQRSRIAQVSWEEEDQKVKWIGA